MSTTYHCDRCGKPTTRPTTLTLGALWPHVDLCEGCRTSLTEWMYGASGLPQGAVIAPGRS